MGQKLKWFYETFWVVFPSLAIQTFICYCHDDPLLCGKCVLISWVGNLRKGPYFVRNKIPSVILILNAQSTFHTMLFFFTIFPSTYLAHNRKGHSFNVIFMTSLCLHELDTMCAYLTGFLSHKIRYFLRLPTRLNRIAWISRGRYTWTAGRNHRQLLWMWNKNSKPCWLIEIL